MHKYAMKYKNILKIKYTLYNKFNCKGLQVNTDMYRDYKKKKYKIFNKIFKKGIA